MSKRKKILFIASAFYPANTVAVLRTGQWVKYLALNGYDVTVLTNKKYPFMWGKLDNNKKLPQNVTIIEVDYLPKMLQKKDLPPKTDLPDRSLKQQSSFANNIKKVMRYIRRYVGNLLDIYDLWVLPAAKNADMILKSDDFGYIISSFSPPATHKIAHRLKKKYPHLKWIADFRDLWAYNHLIHASGPFKAIEKMQEKRTIGNADALITVSDHLSHVMQKVYPNKPIYTIENGFDPDEFISWEEKVLKAPKINDSLSISYMGTIYPQKQDPSILFEAVNEMIEAGYIKPNKIKINFYGNSKDEICQIINSKDCNRYGVIGVNGLVSRQESLRIQKESDLLLFLEWNDPSAKGVLTGKLFEYMVSGVPIMSVGITEDNSAGELIKKSGTGELFIDKNSIMETLKRIYESKKIEFYKPDIDIIKRYSKPYQVDRLIKIMEQLNADK